MKKLILIVTVLLLVLFSCTDLTDLENRLTDLENRVDVIEQLSLSEVVLEIETMQGKVDAYDYAIDSLQDKILEINQELQDAGSNDATDIYWGDVMNDDDFSTIVNGNYTKITGNVFVTKNEHVAMLDKITFIGSNLQLEDIYGDISFNTLEIVSGSIKVERIMSQDSLALSFPSLLGVSYDIATSAEETLNLSSLDLPVLSAIGGSLSLMFPSKVDGVVNSFISLNIPKLTMIASDLILDKAELIEDLQIVTSFIGGDLNLNANAELSLAHSDINSIEIVEGSIIFTDNYLNHNGEMLIADLEKVTLLSKLTYLGGSLLFEGSQDLYNLNGFGALIEIPGSLHVSAVNMGYGLDEDIKFFNKLETVGGDFTIVSANPETKLPEDGDEFPILDGFESLVSVGGDFVLSSSEIYGFNKLISTGALPPDSSVFSVRAVRAPAFSSLTHISGSTSEVEINIETLKIDNMFPSFGLGKDVSYVDLIIRLSNLTEKQEINGGFSNIERLASLKISSTSQLDSTYMIISNGAFESLTDIGSITDNVGYFDIELGFGTDLSTFKNYFVAQTAEYVAHVAEVEAYNFVYDDYLTSLDLYKEDSIAYEADPNNVDKPEVPTFDYTYPEFTSHINIHSKTLTNTDNPKAHFSYTDNYTEVKLDESSSIPAIVQCFMKFGRLTEEELNYTN